MDNNIAVLLGKTLRDIKVEKYTRNDDDRIIFMTNDDEKYMMYHSQDCCESVNIAEIVGDLNDLLFSTIIKASEDTNKNQTPDGLELPEYHDEYFTWTFYNLATAKGHVTIRWFGSSNGYYSESVDFVKM